MQLVSGLFCAQIESLHIVIYKSLSSTHKTAGSSLAVDTVLFHVEGP